VLAWPCAEENKGKKKRGVGPGGDHFKWGWWWEGKEGGPVGGAMQRATEGGGLGPTVVSGGQHRPWNGGCGWHAVHGAAMLHDRHETGELGEADVWAPATVPRGLAVHSVQTKFNEF
jgi:hypothetical protein